MALGGATAPWLTVGFLIAVWGTRHTLSTRDARIRGIATLAIYLIAWLVAYHATFSVRELIKVSDAWREATPWLVLTGPVAIVLGVVAAHSHRNGIVGDICLALPMAWSMPEILGLSRQGWSYAVVVALPTAALALIPLITTRKRDMRLARIVAAFVFCALAGLALVPLVRVNIYS
jgi:hypothetical protein